MLQFRPLKRCLNLLLSPGTFDLETKRPTKNKLERRWLNDAQSKIGDLSQKRLLQQRFASMQ